MPVFTGMKKIILESKIVTYFCRETLSLVLLTHKSQTKVFCNRADLSTLTQELKKDDRSLSLVG